MKKKMYVTYTWVGPWGKDARYAVPCDSEEELKATAMEFNSYAAVSNVRINRSGRLPKGTLIKTLEPAGEI